MKKSRFNEQQIAFILKQANDGGIVEDVCQENVRSADDRFRLVLPAASNGTFRVGHVLHGQNHNSRWTHSMGVDQCALRS